MIIIDNETIAQAVPTLNYEGCWYLNQAIARVRLNEARPCKCYPGNTLGYPGYGNLCHNPEPLDPLFYAIGDLQSCLYDKYLSEETKDGWKYVEYHWRRYLEEAREDVLALVRK